MTEWLVGKYMPDLRRREPRNVGVVLFANDTISMRFRGQRPDGSIHATGLALGEPAIYKGWVEFWHYLARTTNDLNQWLRRRVIDNYFLERGGRLLSGEEVDSEPLLHDLYGQLVEETSDDDWKLADRVAKLLDQSGVSQTEHFRRGYQIDAGDTGEHYRYPYAYVNGHRVVADQIHRIGPHNARSRLWEFMHLAPDIGKIVFTDSATDDRSVELLERQAHIVEVGQATPSEVSELFLSPPSLPSRRIF